MFEHPVKQYALFKKFEAQVENRELEGVPDVFAGQAHARAYFGIFRLVLGEREFVEGEEGAYVEEARLIDQIVRDAVAENSLNPQNIEAAIRKALLPRLFGLMGLERAKSVIEQVIQVTRVGLSRGGF